jgi:hypothetical protein
MPPSPNGLPASGDWHSVLQLALAHEPTSWSNAAPLECASVQVPMQTKSSCAQGAMHSWSAVQSGLFVQASTWGQHFDLAH